MASETRYLFDNEAFQLGLQDLSVHIAASEVLAQFRPIEMIASGGYVSVSYLHNRKATQDLDFFLNDKSFGQRLPDVKMEIKQLVRSVADDLHYAAGWCNDEVSVFLTLLNNPEELFHRSKSQGAVLYSDDNLVVYAVLWEWVLARKMKRLQMEGQPPRPEDWNDCVSITMLLYRQRGQLSLDILKEFDHPIKEPPVLEKTISDLRRLTLHLFKVDPFHD